MVVKEVLQRWAARLLQPWLQQEAEVELEVSLFGLQAAIRDFNLNATSLNSNFMESSRLVIKSVTFGEVVVKFSAWRSPFLTLQIHGMRIVLSPRALDDKFWENNDQQWTAEQERKNILLCIDPQGSALNDASKRVTGTKPFISWFVTMLTYMILQGSRLVLHNTSIEVHIPEKNLCEIQAESAIGTTFYRCCLRAKTISLEDGFSGHNKLPGGFLIAVMISALYSYKGSKGCKTCSIKDLGLELDTLDSCSSHPDAVNEKYVILFKDIIVSARLKHLQLTDLEFGILELRFCLYPRDMILLMIILEHISYSAAKSAVSAYPRQHEEKFRNRWQRALENINRVSPKCRLQKLVKIVILRLRYAKAYESWLLEVGMGLKRYVGSKLKKVKSKQFSSCIERLWKEVCEKENELPVEAVVQVRRVVRHRVLAQLKKDDSEEVDSDSRRREHFLYLSLVVVPFSFLLQCLCKLIGKIYAFIFYSCSILLNSVYFFCPFLKKGPSCQPLVENPKAENQTHNFYDSNHSWYLFNVSKLCYRVNICKAFIGATCNEVNEIVLEEKIEKDVAISSTTGKSVLVVLENLCLVYSSNGYVMEFSIVCEDMNGQIFSSVSTKQDIKPGRSSQSRQSADQYSAENVKNIFLSTSSAPQVHCFDQARNTVGRVGVSSISNLVLKDHQGQMWSDWESKSIKPSFPVGVVSSTFTRKPFILSEVQSFVIDPSPANSSLGLLLCNLALGQLFFDLDCSSLTYLILLLLQLLDVFQWTSSHRNKKHSHSSNFFGRYPIGRDGGWEELCDLYTDKMKQAMLSIIPEKTIHFTAAITGPKIQFSPFSEEYIKFEKQNAFAESHAEFSFVINLGNLEVAIWPPGQGRALASLEEQDTTSNLEYVWLKKLPHPDDSRDFRSDFCMEHKQIGSNFYLKLENAVVFLENKYKEKQLPLVKPLTVTLESSICRDEVNSLLYLDKSLLASLGCKSSAVALICSVDELLFVAQIFEDYAGGILDTFNQFAGRDKYFQQELCRDLKLSHNADYFGSKLLFTSFKVVSTLDLETVDLCFEGSRGCFSEHSWKEVESGSKYVTKYERRKEKSKMDDIWRRFALPDIDINLSFQNCVMEFSWVDSKQTMFSLSMSEIHAYVSDSITRNYRNSENEISEFKFRQVEGSSGTHPMVLMEIFFSNCTFKLCVGLHVYGHILQEVTTRSTAGTGSSLASQMTLGSASCALPHESFNMQLDEIQQESPKRRNIPENHVGDISSSVSRNWLLFDVDLSECLVTDSSLETLISEAMKKVSGGRRLCASFALEEGFKSFSGDVQGGNFILQTKPLSILIQSCRAYLVILECICSVFLSSFEKLKVITSEVPGKRMVVEEGPLHAPLRRTQRSSSFSHASSLQSTSKTSWNRKRSLSFPHFSSQESFRLTSGMGGVNPKKPLIGILSFRIQQFSLVLAHVDALDGEQGVLLEMDMKTTIESEKMSCDLSRLTIIGLHTRKKITKGKEKADYIPHFESTSLDTFSDEQKSHNLELSSSSMNLSGRNESNSYKEESVQETQSRRESTSRNYYDTSRDCCILECMTASLSITHVSVGNHRDEWDGQASVSGVNLAFTTSEILMFLSLVSPFSESTVDEARNPQTVTNSNFKLAKATELEPKIPHGAIVAVKDVEEHLYMAVEKIENGYRLIGVLHYSLVGDRALFMVKYNEKSKSWFSLLSIHARNHDGQPYCVHYHPGSSLIGISSTKNNAQELWCSIPFKHREEDAEEELDFRGHSFNKTVSFVNKKSNGGLAFVNGLPMLVRKPGNPLKLKTFQPDDFQIDETERDGSIYGQPPYASVAKASVLRLAQVNVMVEKLDVVILYETSGMSHFLPLFRACMSSAQYVLQVSSSKLRIISTLQFMLQTYEAQRNMWVELLNPVDIGLVYRVVGAEKMQGRVTSGKIPICFFAILKRVDVFVSEQSLDTCLFLFTELNLAGPYTIKHSPVKAYGCKIENCTGLDLLCSFDGIADVNVAAGQAESFLLRRMISRRGLHLESLKEMTFKLDKSGMVSSAPVQVSLEDHGVTTIMTNIISHISQKRASGSLVVIDVSKQSEDGFSVMVSPMVHIQNASGLSLELHCRRPQQREDEGVVVLLKHGESIDDSMGSFDAIKFTGEMRKALSSFSHGNYVLCVRPATSDKSVPESERSPSFEWSEDLKGVKAVRVSGLFEKLTYHLKMKFSGQSTQSSFSTIHCGPKMTDSKFKDLYFLVRTTRRKVPVTRSHTSGQQGPESSTVALYEQQDILILPTIQVSNLLEEEIAVSSDTNADEVHEHSDNHAIVQGGNKTYMYEDLSSLFLTIMLCDLKRKSNPVNVGEFGKLARGSKGDMHGLDVELDFGDGQTFAMLRLSRGETGFLEAIIYTPYVLKNHTDMPLVCFASEQKTFLFWREKGKKPYESMISGHGVLLNPKSKTSWFQKSSKILIRRSEQNAAISPIDLESFSGFTEMSLEIQEETGLKDLVKVGVGSQLALSSALEPTQTIYLVPRYIVVNQSSEDIFVCPKGLQETGGAQSTVSPGQKAMLHIKIFPGEDKAIRTVDYNLKNQRNSGIDLSLYFQFSLREPGWSWSGPICAASLGRFFLKFRSHEISAASGNTCRERQSIRFAVVDVKEERSSLIMYFNMQSPEYLPYQITNSLRNASILFHQKDLTEEDTLNAGATVGYVWDDLSLNHELIVQVAGTQFNRAISLDKLCTWKPFHKRQNKGFSLTLSSCNGDDISDEVDLSKVGYEVYADGPIRILQISEIDTHKRRERKTHNQILNANAYCKVSYIGISLLEEGTEVLNNSNHNGHSYYMPIIVARTGNLMLEFIIASKHTLCQFKVKTLEVDERWQGAPFAAMLRMHEQDSSDRDEAALHMSAIIYNGASNPYQVKYLSILLMAIDLNIDEDTLMKLVPFYRNSLAKTTSSREIYFESFEIHPVKIIGSFLPGQPNANYTSAQETLRSLLHSVIKVPAIKRASVELNGILLSNALVTFRQLGIKCAQHYSWYIMRAIYIAKGSKLLPPALASIFDDSASSSFHFFFDPSKGSVDLQGFTIGMFNLLRKGIKKKGFGAPHSVDLGHTMKKAGSNVLFAVITEVSDSVLKGAETSGLDGLVNGFRRGILKVAMEPSTLRTAIVKGSSTRRIKLDNSAAINEMYIEGYLQAMLDTLYRQVYVKVKVVDDQVTLKNLPPNSALIDEIIKSTKNFLSAEGLLADTSLAGYSPRRLHKDFEWKLGPQLKAVCEQLFIIFTIRALRAQTWKILGKADSHGKSAAAKESSVDQMKEGLPSGSDSPNVKKSKEKEKRSPRSILTSFLLSSAVAYADGRLCRHIPNPIVRQIVSGFLLSFVE